MMSATPAAYPADAPTRSSHLLAYAQLVRIPNLFTAMADIALAALALGALPGGLIPFLFLLLASGCLYCSGMVWNDYFDYDQDLKERPERPLPSHRIARNSAARLGMLLMGLGLLLAVISGLRRNGFHFAPLGIAALLGASILLYDSWLKRTFLGPVNMGACRFLNVLFGLTVSDSGMPAWGLVLALVIGLYITGVTWFARREARISKQLELMTAALVMLTALAVALFVPAMSPQLLTDDVADNPQGLTSVGLGRLLFPYLLVGYGFWIGIPAVAAIRNPSPKNVQRTVTRAVVGLIILDALLALPLAGMAGLLIVGLLPLALFAGRWVYST